MSGDTARARGVEPVGRPARSPEAGRTAARRWVAALVGVGVALLVFVLYLATLAPTVLPYELPDLADSDMLQMQACVLGIAHPTGYPTWTMVSHLFSYLPFGDCAYRVNLASAVYATAAVSLVYAAGVLLTRRVVAAAVGSVAFGVGPTLWSQAVIAEVYTLNALLVALNLVVLLLWREGRQDRYLVLSAFLVGLAMTNHLTSGLLLPASFLFVAVVDRRKLVRWGLVLKGAGAFLLGLTPYLYLPIRSPSAPMYANNPDNLQRFWWVVSGGGLRGGFFAFGPAELPGRLAFYGHQLLGNSNWFLLAAGMVGFAAMLLWDRKVAALTGFLFFGWTFYSVENDIPDVSIYFVPTYLVLALWICTGIGVLLEEAEALVEGFPRAARRAVLVALSAVLLILPLVDAPLAYAQNDRSGDRRGQKIVDAVAENAAPNATVLHYRSPLWYMVLVQERRRDLTLVDPFQPNDSIRYNDVVWPARLDLPTAERRYGTGDDTGASAARKAAKKGPVYVLAEQGIPLRPFRDAGFRTVHVRGTLYELVPPDVPPHEHG